MYPVIKISYLLDIYQVTRLPCEIEALCIAAAIKHISPYIIQSEHTTCLLTDIIA